MTRLLFDGRVSRHGEHSPTQCSLGVCARRTSLVGADADTFVYFFISVLTHRLLPEVSERSNTALDCSYACPYYEFGVLTVRTCVLSSVLCILQCAALARHSTFTDRYALNRPLRGRNSEEHAIRGNQSEKTSPSDSIRSRRPESRAPSPAAAARTVLMIGHAISCSVLTPFATHK
jgi:hypothetical protein